MFLPYLCIIVYPVQIIANYFRKSAEEISDEIQNILNL